MTKATFKPFDAADHLQSEEDVAAYLAAVAEDADPAAMAIALGDVARARRSMSQLARDTGLSREGLHKALSPGGNPSFGTMVKVASALGHPLSFGDAGGVGTQRAASKSGNAKRKV